MVVDYLFRVVQAAVTDLDGFSVEDFSELEGCTRGCYSVVGFFVCLFLLVRTVVRSGIHFRRVLSDMEGRLGQRMLC